MSRLLEAPPRPRSLRHRPRHRRRPSIGLRGAGLITVVVLIATGAVVWRTGLIDPLFVRVRRQAVAHPVRPSSQPSPTGAPAIAPTPTQPAAPSTNGPINTAFPGLTTFRGNASRSFYGEGPVPKRPTVLWRYP
ncbi:MAG TPA: hypothetical protein VF986_05675, partial [Actinomycetota bacterium]